MSAFTGEITVTSLDVDCRTWRLEQPLQYEVGELGSGRIVLVPSSFETDITSIPWLVRGLMPAWGRWSRAAILHDWLYECLQRGVPHPEAPTRRLADAVFHEALLVSEVPRPLAYAMWIVVRLFGEERAKRR